MSRETLDRLRIVTYDSEGHLEGYSRLTDDPEGRVILDRLRSAALSSSAGLSRSDLELIEAEASTAHDYIWGTGPLAFKEPVTKEQASAAIWSIHNIVRAALAETPGEPHE